MPHPSATIVIPCFNHGRFVREAVESCLRQQEADVRIVVVDDGSNDGSTPAACDACAAERVKVIHQENRGLPAARNRGAAFATGEYLVFLDADDWIEPAFVAHLAARIGAERTAGRGDDVSHAYCYERLVERGAGLWRVPDWDSLLMMLTNIHPVTALVRRDRFEAVGGFTASMRHGYEDWDLWLKFVAQGWRGVRVPEPLFIWRRHSDDTMVMNVIGNHEALYRELMQRHHHLYERHAAELLLRCGVMLRRWDMNWLDESGDPIHLRGLRAQRARYEAMGSVRLRRAIDRGLAKAPAPVSAAARSALRWLRGLLPPAR